MVRTCTKCKKEFPATLEFFGKQKGGKFGLKASCKECYNEYSRQWRKNNKEHRLEYDKQYREDNKERIAEYRKQHYQDNKERYAEGNKQWLEKNPDFFKQNWQDNKEYYAEVNKRWRENNREKYNEGCNKRAAKRRAAKLKVTTEDFTRQDVLDKWGTDCHICKKPVDLDNWHQDHVVPLQPKEGKPGEHTLENVKPSHPICNIKKGNKV